jgi:excisionase family DNA binding protein
MRPVRPIPTLDAVATDPTLVHELSLEICAALATKAAAVVATLSGRILIASAAGGDQGAGNDSPLLDIPTVAKLLRVPQSYAYELARRGELPTVKIGPKYVRVRADSLAAFIARREDGVSATMQRTSKKQGAR